MDRRPLDNLSVEELRDLLGVTGTDIATGPGWEKEDLIAVLTTLEETLAEMPDIKV